LFKSFPRQFASPVGSLRGGSTLSASSPFAPDVRVILCELMPMLTVGLSSVLSTRPMSAHGVLCASYSLKVSRVDALSVSAKMVNNKVVRYFKTAGRLINNSVHRGIGAGAIGKASNPDLSVPVNTNCSNPVPADICWKFRHSGNNSFVWASPLRSALAVLCHSRAYYTNQAVW
jgi:hypothetical protein